MSLKTGILNYVAVNASKLLDLSPLFTTSVFT